jgi:hypothetical protein
MPWEIIGAYAAEKALDAVLKTTGPKARKFFAEKVHRRIGGTLADRFLLLEGHSLEAFYRDERLIEITFAGRPFVVPAVFVHTPADDGRLTQQSLEFAVSDDPFVLKTALDAYVEPVRSLARKDSRLFDGTVVRLAALTTTSGVLKPANYFDALATNFAMDHKPKGRADSLREFVHADGHLEPLEESVLVNHVGIAIMVETSDGMLVAQQRSSRVANRPRSISASVSGALNWTDIWRAGEDVASLSTFLTGAYREALEELGIGIQSADVRYLGTIRELLRGGKPEIYFFARTPLPSRELALRHRYAQGRHEAKTLRFHEFHSERIERTDAARYQFQQRVENILEKTGDSANFTFVAGTLLTASYVLRMASGS